MEDLNTILESPYSETHPYERVRIVVIDTGISGSSPYWKRIKAYKDFVSGNDNHGADSTGHGSNNVHLIFQMIADADVFVARVFAEREADDKTASNMASVTTHIPQRV